MRSPSPWQQVSIMIIGINGILKKKNPPELIVDVNGIYYRILMPIMDFDRIGPPGEEIFIHTQLFIKDDRINIYGFLDEQERRLFLDLIKVHGLGPRSALGILSQIESGTLIRAINDNDLDRIAQIKGIGKKKASKILIELKDKFVPERGQGYSDAYNALQSLGLSAREARKRLEGIDESLPIEEIIREALKRG